MAGGYGELKTLHMKDLRWNNPHTKALLDRLGPVPQACGLTRVLSGVKKSDYADLIPGKRAERALQPYYFAFNGLASVLGRWIPDSDQMTFVFEEQRRYSVASTLRAGDIALEARNSQGVPKIKGVSFVPKASIPAGTGGFLRLCAASVTSRSKVHEDRLVQIDPGRHERDRDRAFTEGSAIYCGGGEPEGVSQCRWSGLDKRLCHLPLHAR